MCLISSHEICYKGESNEMKEKKMALDVHCKKKIIVIIITVYLPTV